MEHEAVDANLLVPRDAYAVDKALLITECAQRADIAESATRAEAVTGIMDGEQKVKHTRAASNRPPFPA